MTREQLIDRLNVMIDEAQASNFSGPAAVLSTLVGALKGDRDRIRDGGKEISTVEWTMAFAIALQNISQQIMDSETETVH